MKLVEALRTGKPFRRPSWVEPDMEVQWVQYDERYDDFGWADENGELTGDSFGDLSQVASQNRDADDYEVFEKER